MSEELKRLLDALERMPVSAEAIFDLDRSLESRDSLRLWRDDMHLSIEVFPGGGYEVYIHGHANSTRIGPDERYTGEEVGELVAHIKVVFGIT
jgi:hypothetical protein